MHVLKQELFTLFKEGSCKKASNYQLFDSCLIVAVLHSSGRPGDAPQLGRIAPPTPPFQPERRTHAVSIDGINNRESVFLIGLRPESRTQIVSIDGINNRETFFLIGPRKVLEARALNPRNG